ncbi:Protein HLB1 [Camellia lanceoleosa]|nr:Protein HLB1 [Camellia lanceoleosa]
MDKYGSGGEDETKNGEASGGVKKGKSRWADLYVTGFYEGLLWSRESTQQQQQVDQNNASMELINSVTAIDEEGRSRQWILTFAARRFIMINHQSRKIHIRFNRHQTEEWKGWMQSSDPADNDAWKDKGIGQLAIKCKEGVNKGTRESKPTILVRNDVCFFLLFLFFPS